MKIIFLDIYDHYVDEVDLFPIENKHLIQKTYLTDTNVDNLEDTIHKLIGKHKIDGYYIEVESLKEYLYINIFLMTSIGVENNFKYILDYFDGISLKELFDINTIQNETFYGEQYYISLDYIDQEEIQEILLMLDKDGLKGSIISKVTRIYERGASDLHVNILIAAIGITSSLITIGQYLKDKYSSHYSQSNVGIYKFEILLLKISEISGVNQNDLRISNFKEEDNHINVNIKSRYKDIDVKCNRNYEIIEMIIKHKYQTML